MGRESNRTRGIPGQMALVLIGKPRHMGRQGSARPGAQGDPGGRGRAPGEPLLEKREAWRVVPAVSCGDYVCARAIKWSGLLRRNE